MINEYCWHILIFYESFSSAFLKSYLNNNFISIRINIKWGKKSVIWWNIDFGEVYIPYSYIRCVFYLWYLYDLILFQKKKNRRKICILHRYLHTNFTKTKQKKKRYEILNSQKEDILLIRCHLCFVFLFWFFFFCFSLKTYQLPFSFFILFRE